MTTLANVNTKIIAANVQYKKIACQNAHIKHETYAIELKKYQSEEVSKWRSTKVKKYQVLTLSILTKNYSNVNFTIDRPWWEVEIR